MRSSSPAIIAAVTLSLAVTACSAQKTSIHLEAEDAQLTGLSVMSAIPGYSGTGYVGHFEHDGDKLIFTIPHAHAGIYDVRIRYSSPGSEKGFDLVVNGAKYSGMFAKTGNGFETASGGRIELAEGTNTIGIERGWGWYYIDSLDIVPAKVAMKVRKPDSAPVDPQASPNTRRLLAYLAALYGRKTLSGQYNQPDNDYIQSVTGKRPAIYGSDFIEYSPSRVAHGSDPKGETERMITVAQSGQIVTMCWHWNAPADLIDKEYKTPGGQTVNGIWWRGFYTDATTFDLDKALSDPNSENYKLLLRDMDVIAAQLQKFSDAGIPVLWRPLHEAEGGWFWWGAKGPEPFKKLWRLMYDRFTNVHHLHNLIWVYCSGTKPQWYPGDRYVDVVGIDAYPSDPGDPLSATWETLNRQYGGRKVIAITEFGGVPDIEKMRRFGTFWSYFVSWTGDLGPHKVSEDRLKQLYGGADVVNKDGLPADISR